MNDQERQEIVDRLGDALAELMQEHGVSAAGLARDLGIDEAKVRRTMNYQEMKPTFIAEVEDLIGVPRGTIYIHAGLVAQQNTPESLIATDPRLHAVYRRSAVATLESLIALSEEERRSSR